MQTSIHKWGNSLAVRIPAALAQKLHLTKGKKVTLELENNRLVICPQYSLEDLLAGITKENMHHVQFPEDTLKGYEEW